ncbi:MAG TPA: DUF1566 domain-containing protein [Deltaproteobacteria bacterium]|nr:DUF1566 domain-containing protein [Deltaproteobacteria bacterium]
MCRIIGGMMCAVLVLMSACGGDGGSDDDTIPAAPNNVSVMAGRGHMDGETGNYALIRWDNVSGATSYTLYYGANAGINTSSSSVSGVRSPYVFSNANVRDGAFYYFALTAENDAGESDLSEIRRMAVLIPRTGQTTSYADKDDGDLEEGAAWPASRFIDNGDQTVTDTLTGLMWQKNPNVMIESSWSAALNLCDISTVGTYDDWRMPNLRELLSLLDYSVYPIVVDITAFPFLDSDDTIYWTSTNVDGDDNSAWCVDIDSGITAAASKALSSYWVWAVRDDLGNATAEVARTGQSASLVDYDDGYFDNGVIWPDVRFVDNGDGTVTDILTGLMWLQDADAITARSWTSAVSAAAAASAGDHHDWRLPNIRELISLLDMSRHDPCLPSGHEFTDMGVGDIYWTSTTSAGATGSAWCIDLTDGAILTADKSVSRSVLPVRSTR